MYPHYNIQLITLDSERRAAECVGFPPSETTITFSKILRSFLVALVVPVRYTYSRRARFLKLSKILKFTVKKTTSEKRVKTVRKLTDNEFLTKI